MKLLRTAIAEVVIIEPAVFGDDRGWFSESFNERRFHDELNRLGLTAPEAGLTAGSKSAHLPPGRGGKPAFRG